MREAVLTAAFEELAETGYAGLSMEAVARRSGVHKTTVYRRWPTREALVIDALDARSDRYALPSPDTGSLRSDLLRFGRVVVENLRHPIAGAMVKALVAAVDDSPEIRKTSRIFWRERLGMAGDIISRAVARGELPAETDSDFLIEGLIAPLYLRLLVTGQPLTAELVERVVDLLLVGGVEGGANKRAGSSKARGGRSPAVED